MLNENAKKDTVESVEEKFGRITRWMHEVRQLEEESGKMRYENMNLVRRRVGQICAELEDIRDILMENVKGGLPVRQLSLLEDQEMKTDPSVQFFGIEWDLVFSRCISLSLNIQIFKQRLSADIVDIIGLSAILIGLSEVGAELGDHLVSLISDRRAGGQTVVSESHTGQSSQSDEVRCVKYRKNKTESLSRKIESNQVNHRKNSININSCQIGDRESNRSGQIKYRKNKTENLATKIAKSQEGDKKTRRKSTVMESSSVKKKTSLVQKVSSIFIDYI